MHMYPYLASHRFEKIFEGNWWELLKKSKWSDLGENKILFSWGLFCTYKCISVNFGTLYGFILRCELSFYQSVAYDVTADQGGRLL